MRRAFHSAWMAADGSLGTAGEAEATFPWWSFTKTVLAAAALRLVEDRRLSLDEPLPGRRFTLRQLLQHRAGVPDYGRLPSYHAAVARGDVPWSRERLLDAVGIERPDFAPGAGWSYSNVGYLLVREAIEAATGLGLAEALRTLVLDRLDVPAVRLAAEPSDFAGVLWPGAATYDPGWVYHGCLTGTPVDAATVLHALLGGRLLGAEALREMLARHRIGGALSGRPWTDCGYGLGLMSGSMGKAGRTVGHSGSGPHGVNAVYHFPDAAVAVTVATFTDGDDEGAAEFEAARLAGLAG